ncbi:MAG: TonB-dependent receptor [Pseudomonas sp.]
MHSRTTQLALCITAALSCSGIARAQDQQQDEDKASTTQATQLDTVTVTGYRASLGKALSVKRNADAIVDAISAEDIGKFPDTNVAESLAHLPGISVDRQFGEGEKVSILGTDPALNRVLLNGQTIASTTWGGDPNDSDNRSFNYSILPSEVVGLMEVYKSPEARIDEGSIGGTVIVHTRKPLELERNSVSGSVGYNYNDLSATGRPNASLMYSWKNKDETFGFLVSASHSNKIIRRDGVEIFGYGDSSSYPDSATNGSSGYVPTSLNTALFQQKRERDALTTAFQWKPNDAFELNVTGLYINEDFNNWNQSRYAYWAGNTSSAQSLSFTNGVATAGTFDSTGITYLDGYSRHTTVKTGSLNVQADVHGYDWNMSNTVGYTRSVGGAENIYGATFTSIGGYSYAIDGRNTSISYDNDPTDASNMTLSSTSLSRSPTYDQEGYYQFDFDHDIDFGPLKKIRTGVKMSNHKAGATSYSSSWTISDGTTLSSLYGGNTPSDYLNGISASSDMQTWATINRSALENYIDALSGSDTLDFSYSGTYSIEERNRAWYIQSDYSGDRYRGNFGVRYVHTTDDTDGYSYNTNGSYSPVSYSHSYGRWLPSFNFAYDLRDDLIGRFSVAKVIARPRYSNMTPYVSTSDTALTASTGNPNLKPYESVNYDASLEWYFSQSSILSGELFYRDISNYVLTMTEDRQFYNQTTGSTSTYSTSLPINGGKAQVQGAALAYTTNFGHGFGLVANYTYADSSTDQEFQLPYSSRNSYNLSPFFENGKWSARISMSYRSEYFTQLGRLNGEQMTDAYTQLDATLGYRFNDHIQLTFNATNLLDETYYSYIGTKDKPYYIYKNGRSYALTLNFKL